MAAVWLPWLTVVELPYAMRRKMLKKETDLKYEEPDVQRTCELIDRVIPYLAPYGPGGHFNSSVCCIFRGRRTFLMIFNY